MKRDDEHRTSDRDELGRAHAREVTRAAETIRGQLLERGVRIDGNEAPEDLADLLTEVQRFESAVAAVGGDSMTNAPDSRYPDDRRLVLPSRYADESVVRYAARINAAAGLVQRAGQLPPSR